MSDVSNKSKKGILRRGWTASVDDYAISGGWSLGGEALMVADASGGIFAFDGKSGDVLWSQQKVHEGSGLATSNPSEWNQVRDRRQGWTSPGLGCF